MRPQMWWGCQANWSTCTNPPDLSYMLLDLVYIYTSEGYMRVLRYLFLKTWNRETPFWAFNSGKYWTRLFHIFIWCIDTIHIFTCCIDKIHIFILCIDTIQHTIGTYCGSHSDNYWWSQWTKKYFKHITKWHLEQFIKICQNITLW
jgi:hypothetical protein